MGPNTSAVFALQDKIPSGKCDDFRDAMNGNCMIQRFKAYFSAANQRIFRTVFVPGFTK